MIDPEKLAEQRSAIEAARIEARRTVLEARLLRARNALREEQLRAVKLGLRRECSNGCGREISKVRKDDVCNRCRRSQWESAKRARLRVAS